MHPVTVDLCFHTSHYSLTQFYVYRLGIEARMQTHQIGFLPLTHNPSHNYSYIIISKITTSLCSPLPPCWPQQTQMPRCKQFSHFRLPKELGLWTHAIMHDLVCLLKEKNFFFLHYLLEGEGRHATMDAQRSETNFWELILSSNVESGGRPQVSDLAGNL